MTAARRAERRSDFPLTGGGQFNRIDTTKTFSECKKMHLEQAIVEYFRVNGSGIIAVYLFGSQASGQTIPGSDVDLAVLFDRSDPDFISSKIEEILLQLPQLLRKDVHPLAMNFASEARLKQIFGKGRCLFVADSRKLAEFKMLAYARIAGFGYYLKKMQSGFIRRVLEAAPSG
jgi:predicted nucleotidyltransferase